MHSPAKDKFVVVEPEAFSPKPMTQAQEIRALLETYPVGYFHMAGYRKFHDGPLVIKGKDWSACATCIIGYVAAHSGCKPKEEHHRVVGVIADAAGSHEQAVELIHWGLYHKLRPEFAAHSPLNVPKAVLLAAYDRIMRGEKITV